MTTTNDQTTPSVADERQRRSLRRLARHLTLAPVEVRAGHCDHDWIKQPDGKTYVCWKCGAEKARGTNESKVTSESSSSTPD